MSPPASHEFKLFEPNFDLDSGVSSLLAEPADESFGDSGSVGDGADWVDVNVLRCASETW